MWLLRLCISDVFFQNCMCLRHVPVSTWKVIFVYFQICHVIFVMFFNLIDNNIFVSTVGADLKFSVSFNQVREMWVLLTLICHFKLKVCRVSEWPIFVKIVHGAHLNSWQYSSGSTLAQMMACCLTGPSYYLNQCWLLIILHNEFENNSSLSLLMATHTYFTMCHTATFLVVYLPCSLANVIIEALYIWCVW